MLLGTLAHAQTFSLQVENDSLAYLILRTDSTTDRWRLAFPVYQMCTGDVDDDGQQDALVGVVKSTRFTLQATTDGRYVVLEHVWRNFGLGAQRFVVKGVPHEEALRVFDNL